jgi:hypothetical protein
MNATKYSLPVDDKSCLIDVISKEAIVRNKAKLNKASVKTFPYATTYVNTLTGERTGHAEMLYYYNNDTWHYSSSTGSTRIFKNKISKDILNITVKVYERFLPSYTVEKVVPLDIVSFFEDDTQPLPKKYINIK